MTVQISFLTHRRSAVRPDNNETRKPERKGKVGILSLFMVERRNRPSNSKQANKALGGKYISKKAASLLSFDTNDPTEMTDSWKSCSSQDYFKRIAVPFEDQQKQWGQAIIDARRLPRTAHFSNNHIMVNLERTKRAIPALKRSIELDALARLHAETMAMEGVVRHSDPRELQASLNDTACTHLGENVKVGESIREIHHDMVNNIGDIRNMTDRRYSEMGMATARGRKGELYLCQIFRG